jgi:hypothetical protein
MDDDLAALARRVVESESASLYVAAIRVAGLARIPLPNLTLFCEDLIKQVENARRADPRWRLLPRFARLEPIAAHAAALRDSLHGLGEDERLAVGRMLESANGNMIMFPPALDALAAGANEPFATKLPEPLEEGWTAEESLDAPWGAPAAEAFVRALQARVVAHGGKKLGMSQSFPEACRLMKALRLLEPHLGTGFLSSLTPKVLRRIGARKSEK